MTAEKMTLIVKGAPAQAEQAAVSRGFELDGLTVHLPNWDQTVLKVLGSAGLAATWFCEDDSGAGALLHYRGG